MHVEFRGIPDLMQRVGAALDPAEKKKRIIAEMARVVRLYHELLQLAKQCLPPIELNGANHSAYQREWLMFLKR